MSGKQGNIPDNWIFRTISACLSRLEKVFLEKKKVLGKMDYLFLTLKMGMEKGLVNKGWQGRQPWHEDTKYNKQSFLVGLFFPTRHQVELEWGKSPLWGEPRPSVTCFFSIGALFQASATMADTFSRSRTSLGPGFQLHSSLLQTGVSETLHKLGKPAGITSWLWMALGKNIATTQQKLL